MNFVFLLAMIAYFAVCLFLILVILFQSGKGGGLAGMLGGGGGALADTFGASGAEKTLSKWTTYCAIAFLVLSLALTWIAAKQSKKEEIFFDNELAPIEKPLPAPIPSAEP